jgi:hypothetical protein
VVEQMLAHEPHVALQRLGLHGVKFIEVERHNIAKAQALLLMHPHQFVVYRDRSASGRQSQDANPRTHIWPALVR